MNLWHTKGFKWKIILSVLVFLLGLVCSTVFSVRIHQNALEARRKTAQLNATTYANYLIEDFSQAIGVTHALEQILISEDGQCKRFETVAQNLSSSVLQSIQLAPNGIVTDIYPAAGNEDGKIDPDKLRPITFDPVHNTYRVLGEKVANAFQDGAKLK